MNIVLIQPPGWSVDTPPYNIALLKAILKNRAYQVICFDLNIELYDRVDENFRKDGWSPTGTGNCWLDREFVLGLIEKYKPFIDEFISKIINISPDVIGFTVIHRSAIFTLKIVKMIKVKEPKKIIILGGPHGYRHLGGLDLIKESAVNAVCLGEGEICFGNLLDVIEKKNEINFCKGFAYKNKDNKIIDCGDPEIIEDLDSLAFADFSDFNVERYKRLPILTSKGCIYKCSFCNETVCMRKFRSRTGSNVYSEITFQLSKYPHIEEFHFNDSLINGDIKMLNELCDLIIKDNIHIRWGGQATIRKEMSKDFLMKLKKAGCKDLSYGVESGSDKILKLMNKKFTAELAEEVIRNSYEAGIQTNFNIIIGFPNETEIEFQETLNFLKRNSKFASEIWLNVLSVSAGSDLDRNRDKWGIKDHISDEWESTDGKNNYEQRLHRLEICKNIIKEKAYTDAKSINLLTKITKGTSMDKVSKEKISFDWNLILECNYRCPYCWFNGQWEQLKSKSPPSIRELIKYWDNIYKRYDSVHINVLGGEPFLYPDFIELVKELSNIHTLAISTNLSQDIDTFVKKIDSTNVKIAETFHPLFAKFDTFVKKAALLKKSGFSNKVAYLAYPPQMKQISYYKEKFAKEGLSLSVMTFWGKYKGVDYPAGYTNEERKIIEPYIGERGGEKFQIIPKKVKGLLCRAGHKHAVINVDGRVNRCGGTDPHEIIGNFFDENFKLLDEPRVCNSEHCPCNEWAFLLVEEPKETIKKPYISRRSMPPYCVFFSWYLNNECNYKCSYCKPQDIKTVFVDINKWIEVWDGIYDKYGSCHIHISGGEPFIYPNFIELITRLSKKHTLEFSTNLSTDIGPFIENISPDRVRLGASFHPEFAEFDNFLSKIIFLKKRGFDVWVNYVAYPPILKEMAVYKKAVEELEIRFSILPYNGEFEGRKYAQNYTEAEKSLLMGAGGLDEVNKETVDWKTDEKKSSQKGQLCRMGQMYARIYPDGEVCRCCGNGALRLGNLLDGTFKLLEEPLPCECENCPCWKCMLVDREDYWPTYWATPGRLNLREKKHK